MSKKGNKFGSRTIIELTIKEIVGIIIFLITATGSIWSVIFTMKEFKEFKEKYEYSKKSVDEEIKNIKIQNARLEVKVEKLEDVIDNK